MSNLEKIHHLLDTLFEAHPNADIILNIPSGPDLRVIFQVPYRGKILNSYRSLSRNDLDLSKNPDQLFKETARILILDTSFCIKAVNEQKENNQ
jgi:hypothetical protein